MRRTAPSCTMPTTGILFTRPTLRAMLCGATMSPRRGWAPLSGPASPPTQLSPRDRPPYMLQTVMAPATSTYWMSLPGSTRASPLVVSAPPPTPSSSTAHMASTLTRRPACWWCQTVPTPGCSTWPLTAHTEREWTCLKEPQRAQLATCQTMLTLKDLQPSGRSAAQQQQLSQTHRPTP